MNTVVSDISHVIKCLKKNIAKVRLSNITVAAMYIYQKRASIATAINLIDIVGLMLSPNAR